MSNGEEQSVPWTKARIVELAEREFPEDFASLPGSHAFKFIRASPYAFWLNYTAHQDSFKNPICSEPRGLERTLVEIGIYDDEHSKLHGKRVYVYIWEKTAMGFMLLLDNSCYLKVPTNEHFMSEVMWKDPFDAVIRKGIWEKPKYKVKAVALWALLAADHIQEFLFYRNYQVDFKPAVQRIAEAARESTEEVENDASMEIEEEPESSRQTASSRRNARRSNKRRKTESDPDEFGTSHQQAQIALDSMAKTFDDLQKQVDNPRKDNAKLLEDNKQINVENAKLKASAQANTSGDNRKDIEIAKLREELDKAEQREFQQWKRANDFERQLKEANERSFKDEK
ncbi:hypothetical protein BU24DRAFT_459627 [Aaosphaeria arxii CBS 175.79]|uniref:Uncharacterized protein n=1 Tax=Aaosphaeria arxii CBS 175.79 TaxID=1450172 RepID=A0A6A5Y586_9PLEO|nr:uncharacterized protein BU24DRAFT_459627 [Aaosphaeria arxii CBS 175.79]KAF2020011.1 hypothetical protein BU24DRAFT_459627 [Aaosphaeria arxii CBS 175.79]